MTLLMYEPTAILHVTRPLDPVSCTPLVCTEYHQVIAKAPAVLLLVGGGWLCSCRQSRMQRVSRVAALLYMKRCVDRDPVSNNAPELALRDRGEGINTIDTTGGVGEMCDGLAFLLVLQVLSQRPPPCQSHHSPGNPKSQRWPSA